MTDPTAITAQVSDGIREGTQPVEMLLNMGPQHPSTHGVFRMVLWVDGEKVVDVEPHIGYLHRGSEKLCEGEQYHQVVTLFDRLDYIGNFNNELAYCMAVEKLIGAGSAGAGGIHPRDPVRTQSRRQPPALRGHHGPRCRRHDSGNVLLPAAARGCRRCSKPCLARA